MIRIFFTTFYRNVIRNKAFFFINLFGFTLGLVVSILIFLFIINELSFDRFHEKANRIHRLAIRAMIGDTRINQTYSSARMFREISARFPQVEDGSKLLDLGPTSARVGDRVFNEEDFIHADSSFFNVFSFQIIEGNFENPIGDPNTIALSESCAKKYFGDRSAIGEKIQTSNPSSGQGIYLVTAVYMDMPSNSHFHFSWIASLNTFPERQNSEGWTNNSFVTYFLLHEGSSPEMFNDGLTDYVTENFLQDFGSKEAYEEWLASGNYWEMYLQPLGDIHLYSDLNGEWETNGNIKYVYIFSAIALFVLVIACINFVNLSTAKSTLRAREVGVRKVAGSTRKMLIFQFIGEAAIITFLALVIAIVAVKIILPFYSGWLNRELTFSLFSDWYIIPILIILGLLLSVLTGLYPAFVLSSFQPVRVLKGKIVEDRSGFSIRNILVIIQFAASIFLIISTIIINKELALLQKDDLGFSRKNILMVHGSPEIYPHVNTFRQELGKLSGVESVSVSNTLPGLGFSNLGFGAEGVEKTFTLNVFNVDEEFLDVLKMKVTEGRFFSEEYLSDSTAALLNETAVQVLGIEDPIGLKINDFSSNRNYFEVIGVIEDFHYESLHSEIRPLVLVRQGGQYGSRITYINIRFPDGYEGEVLLRAEELWKEMVPGIPFVHSYLEDEFDKLYYNESQTRQVFSIMAVLSILVACLGLLGLASYISRQRASEVAIRKVFGASVGQLIKLLLSKYSLWVFISFIIASPVAFLVMSRWLENFAFKVPIGPSVFIISLIVAMSLALITIVGNTRRTAMANPASTLQHE